MLESPRPAFDQIRRAVLDLQPEALAERAIDARILETAPETHALTPGKLSNFRPATGIGRIRIEREGQASSRTERSHPWR